jgi:hypothetical protein
MAQQMQVNVTQLHQLPVIERLTIVTPLGLRFWDDVSGRVIGDGLIVTAYPETQPYRRVQAISNPSGIYSLHHLPGLREVENGAGDAAFWDTHPPRSPFIVEVVDSEWRFQPFLLSLALPVRGVFTGQTFMAGSPPGPTFGIPLFSTASRSVPASVAVIRADLWDPQAGPNLQGGPAAWALLEAQVPGRPPVRGLADARDSHDRAHLSARCLAPVTARGGNVAQGAGLAHYPASCLRAPPSDPADLAAGRDSGAAAGAIMGRFCTDGADAGDIAVRARAGPQVQS